MKGPLVQPKEGTDDPELQKLIQFYEETLGFCPNSIKTMHIRPRVAYAFIELNRAVMENQGRVTSALKRLIGYVCSQAAGCRYCEAHTIRAAERYGAETDKLENIWDYQTHPSFSAADRAALDFSLAAANVPGAVDEEIRSNLRKHWNDGEIVEMMGVISLFGFLNRWNDSMSTSLETDAIDSAHKYLKKKGWALGKHQ